MAFRLPASRFVTGPVRLCALLLVDATAAAGAQWTHATSGTTAGLRGLSAVDERVVWASGARGTVLRSGDGGATWTVHAVEGADSLDFRAVHAFDATSAFVASAGEAENGLARILSTHDRGTTWRLSYSTEQKGVFLDAIAFWDARNGVALSDPVDGRFFVLVTGDSGRSWSRMDPSRLPPVLPGEAAFAASGSSLALEHPGHIWIGTGGGGRGRVMHSSDRGVTWSVVDTPVHATGPAAGIFSLDFFDALNGVAVGGDYLQPRLESVSVAVTRDGGRTWMPAAAAPPAYLSGVSFAGDLSKLVAVGLAGTFVSRDSGRTWSQADTVPLNSVRFFGRTGFAVGPGGRVARTGGFWP